jgi:hypothetical protein
LARYDKLYTGGLVTQKLYFIYKYGIDDIIYEETIFEVNEVKISEIRQRIFSSYVRKIIKYSIIEDNKQLFNYYHAL